MPGIAMPRNRCICDQDRKADCCAKADWRPPSVPHTRWGQGEGESEKLGSSSEGSLPGRLLTKVGLRKTVRRWEAFLSSRNNRVLRIA
jgi:hypothetical protein